MSEPRVGLEATLGLRLGTSPDNLDQGSITDVIQFIKGDKASPTGHAVFYKHREGDTYIYLYRLYSIEHVNKGPPFGVETINIPEGKSLQSVLELKQDNVWLCEDYYGKEREGTVSVDVIKVNTHNIIDGIIYYRELYSAANKRS